MCSKFRNFAQENIKNTFIHTGNETDKDCCFY